MHRTSRNILSIFAITVAIAIAALAQGQVTYYVDVSCGDDSWDGTNPVCQYPDGPKVTIQAAIVIATDGDEIIVAPGTYYEAIDFGGKAIDLHSSAGRGVTTIDATGLNTSVVTCSGGEGLGTVLEGFTITRGNAHLGGGMLNESSSPTVTNCIFTENTAAAHGGGMCNDWSSSPAVTNCIFTGNIAGSNGGGMYNYLGSTIVSDCTFTGNTAASGGGMQNTSSSPTITDCVFEANEADDGGGMYNSNNSNPDITNCMFTNNSAHASDQTPRGGGGVYNDGSSPTIDNCIFTANIAPDDGGGILNANGSSPAISYCTFTDHTSGYVDGGGIYNHTSNPIITNCDFDNNGGGAIVNFDTTSSTIIQNCNFTNCGYTGIRNYNSHPVVSGCSFSENAANLGAGMFNENSSPMVFECVFTSNSADSAGGGIVNKVNSNSTIINCIFAMNVAGTSGGGGIHNSESSPEIVNCLFTCNMGDDPSGGGGAIRNENSSNPNVVNCTFYGNVASKGAAMSSNAGSYPTVANCIMWGNSPDQVFDRADALTTVRYSDIEGGWPGDGNIDADPLFVDLNGNYRLSAGSPCIDKGDNSVVAEETDLDGNPRITDGDCDGESIVDMGAYEYQDCCTPPSFTLTVNPQPLIAGELADFCVSDANPHSTTWLAYSLVGEGTYDVPMLDITLCIANPIQIGSSQRTNGDGEACWIVEIPDNAHGVDVWLQAVQYGQVSNVVATWVSG